jgi:hypothetical protein
LALPEKFNFPVLMEIPDDQDIRAKLVDRISKIFSQWFRELDDVFLLDWENPELTTRFPGIASIESVCLSGSQRLFLYFTGSSANERSVLGIAKHQGVVVYNISLPTVDIRNHPKELLHLLGRLFLEVSALGLHCVATGGAELEMEPSLQSVSDVIRSASQWPSLMDLVEYLCCDKKDAAQLTNFTLVQESGNALLFRKQAGGGGLASSP